MMDIAQQVDALSDQQVLSIVASLAGEFSEADTPGSEGQAAALEAVFEQAGRPVSIPAGGEIPEAEAGHAARELLRLMADVPEMRESLEEWMENPPQPEQLAIPLVLAAPVVFTGCIVLLQVVGHLHFEGDSTGKWSIKYDPARKTPLDKTINDIAQRLFGSSGLWTRGG